MGRLGRGPVMRWIALLFLSAFFCQSPAQAATYILPISGSFVVDGPFQTVDFGFGPEDVFVPVPVSVVGAFPSFSVPPGPGQYWGISLFIEVTNQLSPRGFAYCGGNQGGGPCQAYYDLESRGLVANQGYPISLTSQYNTITISNELLYGCTWFACELGDISDAFRVSLTLPDAFSIEGVSPVPEPSTCAMLLIGFAGIGFLSLRNRKRLSLAG
jgi:hypothetical protein